MFDANPNDFNTLVHGDFWMNIIMIEVPTKRSDDEVPCDNMKFIDFQDSCWSSAAIDLQYFFNTSLHENLRPGPFRELVDAYHNSLYVALKHLGYRKHIPTRQEFWQQFCGRNFYGKRLVNQVRGI